MGRWRVRGRSDGEMEGGVMVRGRVRRRSYGGWRSYGERVDEREELWGEGG